MSAAVEVNEARVFASGGRDWWAHFRLRHERTRVTVLRASIGGDLVTVACEDAADARSLAAHMVTFGGLPKTAVKVVRLKAAAS